MSKEILEYRWRKFVEDVESRPHTVQTPIDNSVDKSLVKYVAHYLLRIKKVSGHNKSDPVQKIRGIPGVTTVKKTSEGFDDPNHYTAMFDIKFILEPNQNMRNFIVKVLQRNIRSIPEIHILSFKGAEEVKTK